MKSSPVFFLRAAYALFLLQSSSSSNCFLLSGPTPIHAPRPRPITYSIGIGTSDFSDGSVDVSTQGGPPQLNFSSFLNELSLTGASSPVRQAPVSVLSPVLRRSLTVASPPSARLTVDAGVNAIVTPVDVAVDAVVAASDQAVQAVVEVSESSTSYDPPVEKTAIAASSSVPAVPLYWKLLLLLLVPLRLSSQLWTNLLPLSAAQKDWKFLRTFLPVAFCLVSLIKRLLLPVQTSQLPLPLP